MDDLDRPVGSAQVSLGLSQSCLCVTMWNNRSLFLERIWSGPIVYYRAKCLFGLCALGILDGWGPHRFLTFLAFLFGLPYGAAPIIAIIPRCSCLASWLYGNTGEIHIIGRTLLWFPILLEIVGYDDRWKVRLPFSEFMVDPRSLYTLMDYWGLETLCTCWRLLRRLTVQYPWLCIWIHSWIYQGRYKFVWCRFL